VRFSLKGEDMDAVYCRC